MDWKYLLTIVLVAGWVGAASAQNVRPPDLNVQFHRAETAWRSGASMLEAKARVDRVLQALPNDVEALKLRAHVLLDMGRVREALADARHAVQLSPKDGEARLILCEAARRDGDTLLAKRALDAAATLALDDGPLHVRLSWNAMLLGMLDKAEAFARIARARDPQDAAATYQLARVFVLQDKPDDAALILARGLGEARLDPQFITGDSVLVRLSDHPALRSLLDQ